MGGEREPKAPPAPPPPPMPPLLPLAARHQISPSSSRGRLMLPCPSPIGCGPTRGVGLGDPALREVWGWGVGGVGGKGVEGEG